MARKRKALLIKKKQGLYCPAGRFYIDPWGKVENALLTHAHADHAHPGNQAYWASTPSLGLLQKRLGKSVDIRPVPYREPLDFNGVRVSFHPAGHVLGSSQIRLEYDGEVWVVSGDYKRDPDPTCEPFEVVPCDVFITEATFGLPIYRWKPSEETVEKIFRWWKKNESEGVMSVLACYSLGKAQRVLAELLRFSDEMVGTHGATEPLVEVYRHQGVAMVPTVSIAEFKKSEPSPATLVVAPPGGLGGVWMKRFKAVSVGFASGWMAIRGHRRRRGYENGFVLSDHADWPSLIRTVEETGAKKVYVTHGYEDAVVRYLREQGKEAESLSAAFLGEGDG